MVVGPNGAGKTNLLEAVYFGCTGGSPRTSNERELRAPRRHRRACGDRRRATRTAAHRLEAGFQPGEAKRLRLDGSPVESLARPRRAAARERLPAGAARAREGGAGGAAGSPRPGRGGALAGTRRRRGRRTRARSRSATRCSAGSAAAPPARRPRRLGRRAGPARDRADGGPREAVEGLRAPFARLGRAARPAGAGRGALPAALRGRATRPAWRPSWRSAAPPTSSAGSPRTARTATSCVLTLDGAPLRAYGSQGQQRTALLALLFAERELLASRRGAPAADAARRRDVGARLRAPRAARRPAALGRPGDRHRDRGRPRARRSSEEELIRVGAGAVLGPVAA